MRPTQDVFRVKYPDAISLIKHPDPRLKKLCAPVNTFDDGLARLARRLLELMRAANGIGLAAPQAGVPVRLFVCNVTGEPGDDHIFVNPTLTDLEGRVEGEEGCLSIPDVTVRVQRARSCRIHAVDTAGRPIEMAGEDLLARCWQHECDHLDGRLIIDYMSEGDRLANRKHLKRLESDFRRTARAL